MNKAILIINANMAAAQTIKHNLAASNTEIVCVFSMHDALQTFMIKKDLLSCLTTQCLRIRYPSAHLLIKKQSTGLFFLTFAALLGFKSRHSLI